MNYIAIISVLVIIILFLAYVSASNKGWNCTENGCEYVSGGSFGSYNKCNSHCKSKSNNNSNTTNKIIKSCNILQPDLGYNHLYPHYSNYHLPHYNHLYPHYNPHYPSLYYHDNHWKREKQDKNKNHNENNIIINSPTGPR